MAKSDKTLQQNSVITLGPFRVCALSSPAFPFSLFVLPSLFACLPQWACQLTWNPGFLAAVWCSCIPSNHSLQYIFPEILNSHRQIFVFHQSGDVQVTQYCSAQFELLCFHLFTHPMNSALLRGHYCLPGHSFNLPCYTFMYIKAYLQSVRSNFHIVGKTTEKENHRVSK